MGATFILSFAEGCCARPVVFPLPRPSPSLRGRAEAISCSCLHHASSHPRTRNAKRVVDPSPDSGLATHDASAYALPHTRRAATPRIVSAVFDAGLETRDARRAQQCSERIVSFVFAQKMAAGLPCHSLSASGEGQGEVFLDLVWCLCLGIWNLFRI